MPTEALPLTLDTLRGSGHFAFGFAAGWLVFVFGLLLVRAPAPRRRLALYGPFLPFVLGAWAALPYGLVLSGLISVQTSHAAAFDLFLAYASLSRAAASLQGFVATLMSSFHFHLLLVAALYTHLLVHYIRLVRRARLQHAQ